MLLSISILVCVVINKLNRLDRTFEKSKVEKIYMAQDSTQSKAGESGGGGDSSSDAEKLYPQPISQRLVLLFGMALFTCIAVF